MKDQASAFLFSEAFFVISESEFVIMFDTLYRAQLSLNSLHNLNDVFIIKQVLLPDLLRLMLNACSPNPRIFVLLHHLTVDTVA